MGSTTPVIVSQRARGQEHATAARKVIALPHIFRPHRTSICQDVPSNSPARFRPICHPGRFQVMWGSRLKSARCLSTPHGESSGGRWTKGRGACSRRPNLSGRRSGTRSHCPARSRGATPSSARTLRHKRCYWEPASWRGPRVRTEPWPEVIRPGRSGKWRSSPPRSVPNEAASDCSRLAC